MAEFHPPIKSGGGGGGLFVPAEFSFVDNFLNRTVTGLKLYELLLGINILYNFLKFICSLPAVVVFKDEGKSKNLIYCSYATINQV